MYYFPCSQPSLLFFVQKFSVANYTLCYCEEFEHHRKLNGENWIGKRILFVSRNRIIVVGLVVASHKSRWEAKSFLDSMRSHFAFAFEFVYVVLLWHNTHNSNFDLQFLQSNLTKFSFSKKIFGTSFAFIGVMPSVFERKITVLRVWELRTLCWRDWITTICFSSLFGSVQFSSNPFCSVQFSRSTFHTIP